MTEDQRVAIYVEALRDAYLTLRRLDSPNFHGLPESFNGRADPIALMLLKNGGDPYSYVQFVFDSMAEHGSPTYMNMILSRKMVQRFMAWLPQRKWELQNIVNTQGHIVKAALRDGLKLRDILLNEEIPLSAPFRYALAHSEGLTDIVARYREEAERMLLFEPYYKELLGKWLPERMIHG